MDTLFIQMARNVMMADFGFLSNYKYLIHNRNDIVFVLISANLLSDLKFRTGVSIVLIVGYIVFCFYANISLETLFSTSYVLQTGILGVVFNVYLFVEE